MSSKSAAPKSAPVAAPAKSATPVAPTEPARQRAEKGSGAEITVRLPTPAWRSLVALSDAWFAESGVRVAPQHLAKRAIEAFLASKTQDPKLTF